MDRVWKIKNLIPDNLKPFFAGVNPVVAQLLYNRGFTSQQQVDLFFNPDYGKIHDPFLFADMKKAAKRVWRAIDGKEKILIHGDYDADGVTSAAVLFKTLRMLGAAVSVFIPHREDDGYGLNKDNVNKFSVQGIKLLITVDCGITNVQEVAELNRLGIDVIITDHHEPPEILPAALAVLDPKVKNSGYPFTGLAGAGVAYKLVQALLAAPFIAGRNMEAFGEYGGVAGWQKWLLDIVAVGTVADVAPIIDENRILVKWGLIVLRQTRNLGLEKLLSVIGAKKVDSFTIGYQIAPRLNAAGRMNHASVAFELLVAADPLEAERIAWELQKNNLERQKTIETAIVHARAQITSIINEKIFFLYNEAWLPGIIGLIAGKLCEEFYRPVVAMTMSRGRVIGSGRSIEGLHITQGLNAVNSLLARYGGHAEACGFTLASVDVLPRFKEDLKQYVSAQLSGLELKPFIEIEAEIKIEDVDLSLLEELERFAPFGENNPPPLFLLKNLRLTGMDAIGQMETHLRLLVRQESPRPRKLLWFGRAKEWLEKLRVGDTIDAVCELGINEWNGNREAEFRVVDIKKY